ncbi:uncharacterized protein CIMG_13137 [Coccidioides immitis RS]|uniref:Uncharacterized protein n=1 Tax=Coccidioides immitis (strain RS) TaxID=246410 RepID=J3KA65_COCIM|nr:uncharacterized protein CIMG_13137 [Coccidioides immitis RS]EAS31882.3 hypothetical protein CIMG_13137 [Coccidioides immitis RS]
MAERHTRTGPAVIIKRHLRSGKGLGPGGMWITTSAEEGEPLPQAPAYIFFERSYGSKEYIASIPRMHDSGGSQAAHSQRAAQSSCARIMRALFSGLEESSCEAARAMIHDCVFHSSLWDNYSVVEKIFSREKLFWSHPFILPESLNSNCKKKRCREAKAREVRRYTDGGSSSDGSLTLGCKAPDDVELPRDANLYYILTKLLRIQVIHIHDGVEVCLRSGEVPAVWDPAPRSQFGLHDASSVGDRGVAALLHLAVFFIPLPTLGPCA